MKRYDAPTDAQMAAHLRDAIQQLCEVMTRCYGQGIRIDFAIGKSAADVYHITNFQVSRMIVTEEKPFTPFENMRQ